MELLPQQKLSAYEVREIKKLIAEGNFTIKEIAEMYGVNRHTIHAIKSGRSWSWVQ